MKLVNLVSLLLLLTLVACGKGDSKKGTPGLEGQNEYVNEDSIPAEFNPREIELGFDIRGIQRIKISLFGFDKSFKISYAETQAPGTATLIASTVTKNSSYGIGNYSVNIQGTELKLSESGSYACSIKTKNGQIVELEGSCYTRIHVILPPAAEVEVYNVDVLKSRIIFPMTNEDFFKEFDRSSFDADRFVVIAKFKETYRVTGKRIALESDFLGKIIREVSFKKLDAFRELHAYVTDREKLAKMIDAQFSLLDRKVAMDLAGL